MWGVKPPPWPCRVKVGWTKSSSRSERGRTGCRRRAPGDDDVFVSDGGAGAAAGRLGSSATSRRGSAARRGSSTRPRFEIVECGPCAARSRNSCIYAAPCAELHAAGTFDAAAVPRLPTRELGVTAIELMPVAPSPASAGGATTAFTPTHRSQTRGAAGLARLVHAAHREGLGGRPRTSHNHSAPAKRSSAFGPLLHRPPRVLGRRNSTTRSGRARVGDRERRACGSASSAIDGLRLDAVTTIYDDSPVHVLRELR